jgi:hypothetical protein
MSVALSSVRQFTLKEAININPNGARIEDVAIGDVTSTVTPFTAGPTNYDKRTRAVFNQYDSTGATGPVNPELIFETICPITGTNTVTTPSYATGPTIVFSFYAELPVITGNVVWGTSVMLVKPGSIALNIFNEDAWGTETVSSATAVPTNAGGLVQMTMAVANAALGNYNSTGPVILAAGFMARIRIRRLNSNSGDTAKCPVYLWGGVDFQSV